MPSIRPKISVVIPVYNAEKTLADAVCSVFAGAYDDVEVLLVNDGSSDGSLEICHELLGMFPDCIKVINQENLGPFEARKAGIREAKGCYLMFLDADDRLRPDSLCALSDYVDNNPKDIVVFRVSKKANFSEDNASLFFKLEDSDSTASKLEQFRVALLTTDRVNNLCNKMIKRECLEECLSLSPLRLIMAEDKLMCCYAFDRATSVGVVDDIFYYYRTNLSSTTERGFDYSKIEDLFRVHGEMSVFMERWGLQQYRAPFDALLLSQIAGELFNLFSDELPWQEKKSALGQIRSNAMFASAFSAESTALLGIHRRAVIVLLGNGHYLATLFIGSLVARIMELVKLLRGR